MHDEEAFIALLEAGITDLFRRTEAGCDEGGEDPFARIETGLAGAIGWVVERPREARAFLVDAARTPAAGARKQDAIARLTAMLKRAAPSDGPRPEILEEGLVAGVLAILEQLAIAGETGRARDLVPERYALLLAPYRPRDHAAGP